MTNLLTTRYWFSIYPPDLSTAGIKVFILIIASFMVAAIITKILIIKSKERLHRRFLRKIQSQFISNIIVMLVMFFLMYETVPFLGGRFWFIFWSLVNVVWFYFIYRYLKSIPNQKNEKKLEEEYKKYLP